MSAWSIWILVGNLIGSCYFIFKENWFINVSLFEADSNYISYILRLYLKQLFAAINVAFALKK
jgi:hypothetical protein